MTACPTDQNCPLYMYIQVLESMNDPKYIAVVFTQRTNRLSNQAHTRLPQCLPAGNARRHHLDHSAVSATCLIFRSRRCPMFRYSPVIRRPDTARWTMKRLASTAGAKLASTERPAGPTPYRSNSECGIVRTGHPVAPRRPRTVFSCRLAEILFADSAGKCNCYYVSSWIENYSENRSRGCW